MTLPPMWQITPLVVLAVVVAVLHEVGVRRLAHRQTPDHRRRTRRRSVAVYAATGGIALVAGGPLERWAMPWLSIHMVTHVFEMFFLPPLLLWGAPWVPLLHSLPVGPRRRLLRAYHRSPAWAWLRSVVAVVRYPLTGIVVFNGVMVLWHVPAVFDWASWHQWAMDWLMAPSFVLSGLLFWRIILPTGHARASGSTRWQVLAIVVTAFEMLVLAMAMAIFTRYPWYTMNVRMIGPAPALRDQRWAASILWVCGDLWAIPALVLVAYRLYGTDGGGMSLRFERALGRV